MNWFHHIFLLSVFQIVITTTTITQLDGFTLNYPNQKNCDNLPLINFVTLNTENPSIDLVFQTTESHYAIEVYADLYYIGNWQDKVIEVYIDGMMVDSFINTNSVGIQSRFCYNDTDTAHRVYAKTFNQYYGVLNLKFKIDSTYTDFSLGIRNVQVVQKTCHSTCSQCGGPSQNDCKSCPLNSTYYRSIKQCKCTAPYNYLLNGACVIKCGPNQSLTEGVCVDDGRLTTLTQYFTENIDINGWSVIENSQLQTNIQNKVTTKYGIKLFGLFTSNAKISMSLTNSLPNFFRIRFDVYVFGSTEIPIFLLTADAITINVTPLHYYSITSNPDKYIVYHVQTEIDLKANSKISLQLQSISDPRWGIRELYFNQINCQNYCTACATKSKCTVCQSSFYLYKGTCVQQCPPTSTLSANKCVDYDEQTPQATYVQLAFWDNQFSNYLTQSKFNILSDSNNQYGINYNNKRYFGGINQDFFQKVYTNLSPHYNIQISMNVLVIKVNKTIGNLYFSIDQTRQDYSFDDTNYFETQTIKENVPHSNSNFTLTLFPHNSNNSISLGISNLYIIADLCYPLCRRCTGPSITNCLDWIIEQNSNLVSKTCNDGYIFDIKSQKCELCPIGCKTCADVDTCTICETSFTQQGTGCYCQDGTIDELTLDCKKTQVRFLEQKLNQIRK